MKPSDEKMGSMPPMDGKKGPMPTMDGKKGSGMMQEPSPFPNDRLHHKRKNDGRMQHGGRPPRNATFKRDKNAHTGKTLLRILGYIFRKHTLGMLIVLACIVCTALVSVRSATFIRDIIDDYIAPLLQQATPDYSGLAHGILVMAGLYGLSIITNFLQQWVMASVSQSVLKEVRDDMFAKMQGLPVKYFDTNSYGDIMSRYTNDTDTLRQMISQSMPQLISSIITIVSVFVTMVATSFWLTLIVLATVLGMMFISTKLAGLSGKYFLRQQQSLGFLNGYIEEMINGQKVVKVFNHEEECKEDFNILNGELCDNMTKANQFANVLMPIMGNLGHLQYVIVAIAGGAMAIAGSGGMTLGMIASFLNLSKSFTQPINQIAQQFNSIVMALAGAERIFNMMDEKPEEDDGYVTLVNAKYEGDELVECKERTGIWAWKHPHKEDGTITYTKLTGDVRLTDVDFSYVEGKQVLYDVSLFAEPGQKVAFVGATGAGKTTITNLINRFYDIADGKIRYDGININKIKKADLRRSLGVVLQEVNLFTGTVRENIRYGRLDATDEEVEAAAKLANAHNFIMLLPNGYDTVISGSGNDLSQGQRQLLSIARAAVADPPVMILDEATSSIDTRTEAIVQKGMDALMAGRTVFVIAHRLSTIQNSDVIMVMEQGRIIERGNHEKLMEEKGKYYQLYTGMTE